MFVPMYLEWVCGMQQQMANNGLVRLNKRKTVSPKNYTGISIFATEAAPMIGMCVVWWSRQKNFAMKRNKQQKYWLCLLCGCVCVYLQPNLLPIQVQMLLFVGIFSTKLLMRMGDQSRSSVLPLNVAINIELFNTCFAFMCIVQSNTRAVLSDYPIHFRTYIWFSRHLVLNSWLINWNANPNSYDLWKMVYGFAIKNLTHRQPFAYAQKWSMPLIEAFDSWSATHTHTQTHLAGGGRTWICFNLNERQKAFTLFLYALRSEWNKPVETHRYVCETNPCVVARCQRASSHRRHRWLLINSSMMYLPSNANVQFR